jgi:leader peptidase (prepilin peptidase) / N-methyltransferase
LPLLAADFQGSDWPIALFFFGLGLIFGSFATVVSWRVPKDEGIGGRSKCPNCGHQIKAVENIPVVSYFVLGGKCANCGEKISIRYPMIELTSGILFAAALVRFGPSLKAFVYAFFFWALLVLTVIDLDHKLLPNKITYPLFVVGAAALVVTALVEDDTDRLIDVLIGAVLFGGFLFVVAFISPRGMGMGDVKLALSLGAFLGYIDAPGHVLLAMFMSFLLGGVIGIVVGRVTGGGRKMQIPFGPFLMGGTLIAIFWGRAILDWYVGLSAQ